MRSLWPQFFADGKTEAGRALLSRAFATCAPIATEDDALALAYFIRGTWDLSAMANYPYPSNYLTGGGSVYLPAFPLRKACSFLSASPLPPAELYGAVFKAISVINNATPTTCYAIPPNPFSHPADPYDDIWDFQQCTEMQPDSQWFSSGTSDMFFPSPYNLTFLMEHCRLAWGVSPDLLWMTTRYALPSFHGSSRILFTNGLQDPWSGASIQVSPAPERDLIVLNITDSAHHLDLFFKNAADPPSVTAARNQEIAYLQKWVAEAREERARAEGEGKR